MSALRTVTAALRSAQIWKAVISALVAVAIVCQAMGSNVVVSSLGISVLDISHKHDNIMYGKSYIHSTSIIIILHSV